MRIVQNVMSLVAAYLIMDEAGPAPWRAACIEAKLVMQEIHGQREWYRARVEPETEWRGRVQKRESLVGPNTRLGLDYELVTEVGILAIYAANVAEQLEPLVGGKVLIVGKLIDLTKEGGQRELWIGRIGALVCHPQ